MIKHGLNLADRKEAVPRWEFVTSMTSEKPLEHGIAVEFACITLQGDRYRSRL